jgi:hypothetical protein
MHSVAVTFLVLGCSFGAALFGLYLRPHLPSTHLDPETKRAVELAMGLIATLTGLVLGLLVSTAKGTFDTTDTEVKEISAKLVLLDHILGRYGPETAPIRAELRHYAARKIDQLWSRDERVRFDPAIGGGLENALDRLSDLSPSTDVQRELKSRALTLAGEIARARWLLIEGNAGNPIPRPFLAVVILWVTVLFLSFGLFAPRNAITVVAMGLCALSVATAFFLILELSQPFGGVIELSSAAARNALANMGH